MGGGVGGDTYDRSIDTGSADSQTVCPSGMALSW